MSEIDRLLQANRLLTDWVRFQTEYTANLKSEHNKLRDGFRRIIADSVNGVEVEWATRIAYEMLAETQPDKGPAHLAPDDPPR